MIKRTISGQIDKGDVNHNNRKFIASNVDKIRVKDNITIVKDDIREVYHELFDETLKEFNARQTRKDRIIHDYREHIRHGRQEKEFYEVIFQVGNMEDTPVGSDAAKTATEILREFTEGFIKCNPHIRVFNAVTLQRGSLDKCCGLHTTPRGELLYFCPLVKGERQDLMLSVCSHFFSPFMKVCEFA